MSELAGAMILVALSLIAGWAGGVGFAWVISRKVIARLKPLEEMVTSWEEESDG